MDKQEVASRINRIFVDAFEIAPERITPEAHIFTDLGLDSLDIAELMMSLQEAFSIQIRDGEEVRAVRTVDELCDFILKTVEKPPAPCESGT